MRIKDLLKVEAIELGVSAANKEAAIDKLVALHDKVGNLADVEGYKAAILKRESESTLPSAKAWPSRTPRPLPPNTRALPPSPFRTASTMTLPTDSRQRSCS